MLRQRKYMVLLLLTGLFWGCQHKPPPLNIPHTPVIEYGKPGAISR